MAKPNALKLTGMAKDVWKGMSVGVEKGRGFNVQGRRSAKAAMQKVNSAKKMSYNPNFRSAKLSNNIVRKGPSLAQKGGNFVGGGIRDTSKAMKKGQTFGAALKTGHSTNGKLDMKKVAGTYVGASAVARVATGGGVMKDKNGNTNLIGIPFI